MQSNSQKIPIQVWTLTLAAFAIGTAEFIIAGLLSQVAKDVGISEGRAGDLITAYALAIVIGGPILTLWLSRFEKRSVLWVLMVMFIAANLIAAFSTSYSMLIFSRVLAGLTQGPFFGIGAVVATRLVAPQMAGRAVGHMFAGLTLANVLGVPAGAWIGNSFGWSSAFVGVATLGALSLLAITFLIKTQGIQAPVSIAGQLLAFRDRNLLASFVITGLGWIGFMTLYAYIEPIAEHIAGFDGSALTGVLVVIGAGLVVGNHLGARTADANLRASLIGWPAAMVVALIAVGVLAPYKWPFLVAAFVFGITAFANVPSMQMRVMRYGSQAPELAATANISAFNLANAMGAMLGGYVLDSHWGAAGVPFAAAIIPAMGVLFILSQEGYRNTKALTHRALD